MSASDSVLVFDVGGTSLRGGVYDLGSESLARRVCHPTPSTWSSGGSAEVVSERLKKTMALTAEQLLPGDAPVTVSVAFPGPIDTQGRVLAAPTVWGGSGKLPLRLAEELRELWDKATVTVLNDVTAAGYGYRQHRDEDLCVLTVSSGVGHKVFVAGRPVVGPGGRGGEIGHLRVDFSADAPRCECGGRGHLGAIASGRGALLEARRRARRDLDGFRASAVGRAVGGATESIDNEALATAFRDGDGWATSVVEVGARRLGQVLASLHVGVGVERFVVFGGFALALGERYRGRLVSAAAESCWDLGQCWNEMIELADPSLEAGLIGAGRFAAEQLQRT